MSLHATYTNKPGPIHSTMYVYTSIHTVYCGVFFYLVILPANTYCNGQCHEISNAFIWSKNDFKKFFELLKIFINFTFHNADTVMAYSHRLHGVSRVVDYTWIGVCVVVDYTVYTLTQCLWSHRLRSNMTTWTPKVNFEGFSLTLKEQSGKRSTSVCLHIH